MDKTDQDIKICQSKGGMKFELIISDSSKNNSRNRNTPSRKDLSLIEIEQKLEVAKRRRLSYEHLKQKRAAQWLNHITDVQEKKKHLIHNFQISVLRNLNEKMKNFRSNRETYLGEIQSKNREKVARAKEIKNTTLYLKQNHFNDFCKRLEEIEKDRQTQLLALQQQLSEQQRKIDEISGKIGQLEITNPQNMTSNVITENLNE